MARRGGNKSAKNLWVFCEGKTEYAYFEKLRVSKRPKHLRIAAKDPKVTNVKSLVDKAVRFKSRKNEYQDGDRIYCVFDMDNNTKRQLDNAVVLASENNISLIFSNPSFEYWILCHYELLSSSTDVQALVTKIKNHIPKYRKGYLNLYALTEKNQKEAIKNAKRSCHLHEGELISKKSNPCTLVYKLIELIEQFS